MDQPILGVDFLAEFDLLVDKKNRQVLHNLSFEPLAPPRFSPANSSIASVFKLAPDVASPLDEFPGIHKHLVNSLSTTLNMWLKQKDNRYMLAPAVWIKLS